jgi:hypothetical protein
MTSQEIKNFVNFDKSLESMKSSYEIAMHSPIGPKSAKAQMNHVFFNISTETGSIFVDELKHIVFDYPFADSFNVIER